MIEPIYIILFAIFYALCIFGGAYWQMRHDAWWARVRPYAERLAAAAPIIASMGMSAEELTENFRKFGEALREAFPDGVPWIDET